MTAKRRRFTADFKKRVALEALRGDRTIQELAAKHEVHPNQVGRVEEAGGGGPWRGVRVEPEGGRRGVAGEGAVREDRGADDGAGFFRRGLAR